MRFGAGSGPVFLSDVVCQGDEKSLLDCYYSTFYVDDENICGHNNDVGIMCEGKQEIYTVYTLLSTLLK